jgi:16S rRNA (cytosine967-C5)-methyltransferase
MSAKLPLLSQARVGAFEVLQRVATQNSYASNLLSAPRFDKYSTEDRGLLQELVLGVLRWQGKLDFLIERHTRREIDKLDLELVIAMRLGLYQLLFLDRIPAFAAVNESVNLAKEYGKESGASLVNAVLRGAQRELQFNILAGSRSPVQRLSVETSHPIWLVKRWMARFGETEAREMALANNKVPHVAFRFNAKRSSVEDTIAELEMLRVNYRPSPLTPGAFVVESGSLSPKARSIKNGWVYAQDESSQLIARLAAKMVAANQPAKVLDICSAPGSKTTLIAAELAESASQQASTIVATDLHFHRLRTLKELSKRLGAENISTVRLNAENEMPFKPESFDLVLLDAPCSGLGTLQRNPEIKWRVKEDKIIELAELQKKLLVNAATQVADGGLLVYSVCSTEPEEGEDIINWFRRQNPEYRDITRERLTELGIDPTPLLTASFGARTFTHKHGSESFFFCVLWKRR